MRGHVIGLPRLPRLLGITVMGMLVVFMARSFAMFPQPGEAIPDSLAATLRGGTCYSSITNTCKYVGMGKCNDNNSPCALHNLDEGNVFGDESALGNKPAGDKYCCGSSDKGCSDVWTTKTSCASSTSISPP